MNVLGTTTRQAILLVLLFLVGATIFGVLVAREGVDTVLSTIIGFGLLPFCGFVTISLVNFALYTYRWQYIVNDGQPKSQRIGFWRLYMHRMSGFAGVNLLPLSFVGSEPIRVALLAKDGVSTDRATSSVIIDIAFELVAFILFVGLGVVLAVTEGVALGNLKLLAIVMLGSIALIMAAFYYATVTGKGFFGTAIRVLRLDRIKRLQKFDHWILSMEGEMTKFMGKKPLILIWLLFLSLVMTSFKAVEQLFIAHFLGVDITFGQAFLTATIPGLALLIPVPSGLGFLEAGNTAIFALLGIPINAVALVLIIRLRDALFVTAGIVHGGRELLQVAKKRLIDVKTGPAVDKKG